MADLHLARAAEESLERLGDYDALWFEGRWFRSAELHERAARLAGGLRALGIEPGDRVVVLMANCPEVAIAYDAIWRAGAVVTPAIFLLPPAELAHIVRDSGAAAVLATPELAENAEEAGDGATVVTTEAFAWLEQADPLSIAARAASDPAALLYTGGTTGRAKGVLLSHENLWHSGKAGHDAGHVPGLVRGLNALPLSHAYGLLVTVVGFHAVERHPSVLMRWFDPQRFLELAQEHRTQITAVVPSMLQLLLGERLEEYDLSELRYIVSGGAPLPPDVAAEVLRRLPHVEIREGWLYTGDLGYLDEDGYLYVVDRKKDLIIRGGFNVFPRDVEEALLEHPAVAAAGVVGRADEEHGEEVVAFVELRPRQEVDPDKLIAWSKERIGGYKYPREVHVLSSLPLTPVGKVDRRALRTRILEEATA